MADFVYFTLTFIDSNLGIGGLFALCFLILSAVFIFALALALFVKGYTLKKRLWFFAFSFAISGLLLGLSLIFGYGIGFSVLLLSIGALFCIPIFTIRVKRKADKSQLELARFIDDKLRSAGYSEENQSFSNEQKNDYPQPEKDFDKIMQPNIVSSVQNNQTLEKEKPKKQPCEIDFSHVKNVISRLEYFPLNANDKKQVQDLQSCVYNAENGDYTPQLKSRINDGLGSLLKIMAKYGV